MIDEYEYYLSNHSLSKKFIVCLDFESLRSKFERGFESGLKEDLITQEDRNEYSSISNHSNLPAGILKLAQQSELWRAIK